MGGVLGETGSRLGWGVVWVLLVCGVRVRGEGEGWVG